jgi:hypothetical protein
MYVLFNLILNYFLLPEDNSIKLEIKLQKICSTIGANRKHPFLTQNSLISGFGASQISLMYIDIKAHILCKDNKELYS